jgi:hypothetical protein
MAGKKGGIKASAIIFHTDFIGELKKVKVNEGTITLGDKEWFVGKIEPFMIKTGISSARPFYFLQHNSLYPAGFRREKEVIEYEKVSGNEEQTARNYQIFIKKLRKKGMKRKLIPPVDKFIFRTLKPLTPEFYKTKHPPELLGETTDMRFLKQMKKYMLDKKGGFGGSIMGYLLAYVFGVGMVIAIMYISGMVKF